MNRFEQTVLLKHAGGITAQWLNSFSNQVAICTYSPKDNGKYSLDYVSSPWTGINKHDTDDSSQWELTIIPGYEKEREQIASEAMLILTCLNASVGGERALQSIWNAPTIGFDWPEHHEESGE